MVFILYGDDTTKMSFPAKTGNPALDGAINSFAHVSRDYA
jgi:hypothetical protein